MLLATPVDIAAAPESKAALRARMAAAWRAGRVDDAGVSAERAAEQLASLIATLIPTGAPIALYAATPDELDTAPSVALLQRRHPIAFPRLEGDQLRWLLCTPERLIEGPRRLRQPPPESPAVSPALVVVPGRAFATDGARLGRGGGHYDRALARLEASVWRVGFCQTFQITVVPTEPHDLPMHWLVTPDGPPLRCRDLAAPHHPQQRSAPPVADAPGVPWTPN